MVAAPMRRSSIVTVLTGALAVSACAHDPEPQPVVNDGPDQQQAVEDDNPLMRASTLLYEAPNYAEVELAHYRPAFERGMQEHAAEIAAIANNEEPPTFVNTRSEEHTSELQSRPH